jgi:hypothetical protein
MATQMEICDNVLDKLDNLPLDLSITDLDIVPCLIDAQREMGISDLSVIDITSANALYLEIRTQWYMLGRIRISKALDFKYSTGVDGKTIDKTSVSKAIGMVMDDLDVKFNQWFTTASSVSSTGQTWTKTTRTNTRLGGDS